jgi:hypothetical protein
VGHHLQNLVLTFGETVQIAPVGIDDRAGSLESLLEQAERDKGTGMEDAPWPVHHPQMPGEPTRVSPSRARKRP